MAPSHVVVLGWLCGCPRGVERASELCSWPAAPSFPMDTRPPACYPVAQGARPLPWSGWWWAHALVGGGA